MKKRTMILLGFAVLSLAGFARAESALKLGEQDGLPGECEVRDYDAEAGAVRVLLDGAITNLPFSSFSLDAQQKINGWATDKNFLSFSGLRISIKGAERIQQFDKLMHKLIDVRTQKITNESRLIGENHLVSYVVTLENQSQSVIKGIVAEYRIFYKYQQEPTDRQKSGYYFFGKQRIDLAPGEKKTFPTKSVPIREAVYRTFELLPYSDSSSGTIGGGSNVTKYKVSDRVEGIHLRFSRVGWDGKVVERDCKNGSVPNERDWEDYELFQDHKTMNTTRQSTEARENVAVLDNAKIEQYTQLAEGGSLKAAYLLYRHYLETGDVLKRKQWADKIREMASKNPDDPMSSRVLSMIDGQEAKLAAE